MAKKSFLDRFSPHRERTRVVAWPFPVDGEDEIKVRMRVLGSDEMEAAYLDAADHFAKSKRKIASTDPGFSARERIGILWRAFETLEGERLAETVDEFAKQPPEFFNVLYELWSPFMSELTARPMSQEQMDAFIEGLKKNTLVEVLPALPSNWLIALITTLASQLAGSTPEKELG